MPRWFRAMTPMSDFTAQFRKNEEKTKSAPTTSRGKKSDPERAEKARQSDTPRDSVKSAATDDDN